MTEEIAKKQQSESVRDSNPIAFLGEIVSKKLLPKSIDEGMRRKLVTSNEIRKQLISGK